MFSKSLQFKKVTSILALCEFLTTYFITKNFVLILDLIFYSVIYYQVSLNEFINLLNKIYVEKKIMCYFKDINPPLELNKQEFN